MLWLFGMGSLDNRFMAHSNETTSCREWDAILFEYRKLHLCRSTLKITACCLIYILCRKDEADLWEFKTTAVHTHQHSTAYRWQSIHGEAQVNCVNTLAMDNDHDCQQSLAICTCRLKPSATLVDIAHYLIHNLKFVPRLVKLALKWS